jgi:glycosyltransferase involved in cell wall biosynthesis
MALNNLRVLMVNKFLYPNGGSETYIFKLGDYLKEQGHRVEYFGMEHEGRCVGNSAEAYTSDMDFHTGKMQKLLYPLKIIYSVEARKKIKQVLDKFKPDVVHLNNFNFQLTPSIILEIKKYESRIGRSIRIIFTAHDYQLVCPNHMMNNPITRKNCEKCLGGNFFNCIKDKCIHGSTIKSTIGSIEGYFWAMMTTYKYIDVIICPSRFLAKMMNTNPLFKRKTIVLHNFIDKFEWKDSVKQGYALYFGRFSEEKGIKTLITACKSLPNIQFVFAGTGPLEDKIKAVSNIKNVGFKRGTALEKLIREACFSIYPSEWYENCPFSVMESQMYGTPVLGADIGGVPELIEVGKTGELFKSADAIELTKMIEILWGDKSKVDEYTSNCKNIKFDTLSVYCEKLMEIYEGRTNSI